MQVRKSCRRTLQTDYPSPAVISVYEGLLTPYSACLKACGDEESFKEASQFINRLLLLRAFIGIGAETAL